MTVPELKILAPFGDLTPYGIDQRFTVRRGGPPQQTGFVAEPATLSNVTLDNISRDLDSLWTPGPFFGDLRTKVGITATATWGATEHFVFDGRADDIPQSYPNEGSDQLVDLTATDWFAWLANAPINMTRPAELTGERIQAVLDALGVPAAILTAIDQGMSMVCAQDLQQVSALAHLSDCARVEFGEFFYDAADTTLRFRDRRSIATDARSTVVQAEYVQGPDPADGFRFVDIARGALPIVNHVELTYGRDGRQVTVRDQTSVDAYDVQALTVSLPFETQSQARCYGKWLLLLYAQPRDTILSITFDLAFTEEPGDPFDLYAEVLGRKEGDLVQTTLDPLAGETLSGEPIVRKQWWRAAEIDFEAARAVVAVQDAWTEGLFYWGTSDLDGPDFYGL